MAVGRPRFLRVRLVMSSTMTRAKIVMANVRKARFFILRASLMQNGTSKYMRSKAPMPKVMALTGQTKPLILPNPHQRSV